MMSGIETSQASRAAGKCGQNGRVAGEYEEDGGPTG